AKREKTSITATGRGKEEEGTRRGSGCCWLKRGSSRVLRRCQSRCRLVVVGVLFPVVGAHGLVPVPRGRSGRGAAPLAVFRAGGRRTQQPVVGCRLALHTQGIPCTVGCGGGSGLPGRAGEGAGAPGSRAHRAAAPHSLVGH